MTRIGLISDTHGYFDSQLIPILTDCDEIWHAGDLGNIAVYQELIKLKKPVRIVSGNIDGHDIRSFAPIELNWSVEKKRIYMTHIGGYPGRYPGKIKAYLTESKPDIFVCGHSHILRVIYDKQHKLLYLNPGSCGKEGFHKVRTALRFVIEGEKIEKMEVIELGTK